MSRAYVAAYANIHAGVYYGGGASKDMAEGFSWVAVAVVIAMCYMQLVHGESGA